MANQNTEQKQKKQNGGAFLGCFITTMITAGLAILFLIISFFLPLIFDILAILCAGAALAFPIVVKTKKNKSAGLVLSILFLIFVVVSLVLLFVAAAAAGGSSSAAPAISGVAAIFWLLFKIACLGLGIALLAVSGVNYATLKNK